MRSRKFLWGLLTGILYFAFLLIMSFLQDRTITAMPSGWARSLPCAL